MHSRRANSPSVQNKMPQPVKAQYSIYPTSRTQFAIGSPLGQYMKMEGVIHSNSTFKSVSLLIAYL